MKRHFYQNLLPLLAITLLLLPISGCDKNNSKLYLVYEPIYSSRSEVLAAINGNPNQKVDSPGKVYIKGTYIFINDQNKGIHVIDNRNPVHPTQVAFLAIPGNQDIAVKDNILYADMYSTLLAIDISDPRHVRISKQLEGVFPMRAYVNGYMSMEDKIITGWTKKYVKELPAYPCGGCFYDLAPAAAFNSTSGAKGIAGSMAKMILINDHLYALAESHTLSVINLDGQNEPSMGNTIMAGFDLETIFPFQNKLFLGSSTGVYIYDLSDPATPVAQGMYSHGRACDPVITDGNYAYVTLHSGGMCGGASNELDVVDVRDLNNPVPVKTYQMTAPTGLTKDGDLLFVCDKEGVKVFDAHDPRALILRTTLKTADAYEALAYNNHLLVTSNQGIYQYDYSKQGIPLLSVLPVGH